MADETVKGLSIQIGADTSQLRKELRAVGIASKQTERELRLINSALRFNPQGTHAIASQLQTIQQQAQEASSKLHIMKQHAERLGKEKVEFFDFNKMKHVSTTVSELAKQTENVKLAAQHTKQAYNAVNNELEDLYAKQRRVTGLSLKGVSDDDLRRLAQQGKITQEVANEIIHLRDNWHKAKQAYAAYDKASNFEHTNKEINALKDRLQGYIHTLNAADNASHFAKTSKAVQRLDKDLAACDARITSLKNEGKRLDDALKLDPRNIGLIALKMKNLDETTKATHQKAKLLKEKIAEYKNAGISAATKDQHGWTQEVERTGKEYEQLKYKLEKAQGRLAEAKSKLAQANASNRLDLSASTEVKAAQARVNELERTTKKALNAFNSAKARKEMKELQTSVRDVQAQATAADREARKLTRKAGTGSQALINMGKALSATITPAVALAGYKAVEAAGSIDASFRNMKKTVQGTPEQFEALKKAAIDFSTTHVTTPEQILEIEAMGGQLGISADKLQAFAEVASNLDIATDMDTETISKSLGQLSNILSDLNHDNLPKFADALVRLGNNSPATESAIMEVVNRIAPAGRIFGMTTPQILGWATAIASTGQNSEAAGTAISKTFSNIQGIIDDTSKKGTAKLELLAKTSGMTAKQFAEAWKKSPSDALQAFIEGLKKVHDNGGSVNKVLDDLGMKGVRQKQALEGLTSTTGVLSDSLKMSKNAWDGVSDSWGKAGDAAREAEQKSEGFSGALKKLSNIGKAAGSSLGDAFAPFMIAAADKAKDLYQAFDRLPKGAKTAAVGIGAALAGLGPALILVGNTGKGMINLKNAVNTAGQAMELAKSSGMNFKKSLDVLAQGQDATAKSAQGLQAGLAGLKTLGFALVVAGIAYFVGQLMEAKRQQDDFNNALKNFDREARKATSIGGLKGKVVDFGGAAQQTSRTLDEMTTSIKGFSDQIKQTNDQAGETISGYRRMGKVIEDSWGKTDLSAKQMKELEYYVKKFNDATGQSISVQDVMNGKYKDAQGVVHDNIKAIKELIEKKKEEVRVTAAMQNLETARKNLKERSRDYVGVKSEYDREFNSYKNSSSAQIGAKMAGKTVEQVTAEHLSSLDVGKKLNAAKRSFESAGKAVKGYEQALKDSIEVSGSAESTAAKLTDALDKHAAGLSDLVGTYTEQSGGISLFAEKLDQTGVSMEAFSKLSQDQIEFVAQRFDGSKESIINALGEMSGSLEGFNNVQIGDKTYKVSDNGTILGNKADLASLQEYQLDGKHYWVTNDGTVFNETGTLGTLNDFVVNNKHYHVTDQGTIAEGVGKVKGLTNEVNKIPAEKTVTVKANTKSAWDAICDFAGRAWKAISNLTVNMRGLGAGHATGGVFEHSPRANNRPPRLHADGFIATQPTWYGTNDIVGEAGAEAIIPLTNKHYTKPFADTIAELFEQRMKQNIAPDPHYAANVMAQAVAAEMQNWTVELDGREAARFIRKCV